MCRREPASSLNFPGVGFADRVTCRTVPFRAAQTGDVRVAQALFLEYVGVERRLGIGIPGSQTVNPGSGRLAA